MDLELPDADVDTPARHRALAHPMRYRLLIALGESPATISQLARSLQTRKGNVAHHLHVLVGAGLVRPGEERTVRGGTEQYFARAVRRIRTSGRDDGWTPAMLAAVADEIGAAEADPLLHLRYVRLDDAAAAEMRRTLDRLVERAVDAGASAPRYGVLVAMYRPRDKRGPGGQAHVMAITRGKDKDGPYYKWDVEQGKKYHYTAGDAAARERAKQKAEKQARAAAANTFG